MPEDPIELAGSHHAAPANMRAVGRVPEDQPITVSVYLKPRTADADDESGLTQRGELRARREEDHADDMATVAAFARTQGLAITHQDAARRLVQLRGSASALEQAFGTELHSYEAADGAVYRGRQGALHVPAALNNRLIAVLGLDTTPIATPKLVVHAGASPPRGFLPTEVGALYGFGGVRAAGQCVGIIELGGGYTAADNKAAFKTMGLPVPKIVAVPVDGGTNNPNDSSGANGEVALDIQVVGGVAPGARLAVYFAPNTSQGFADAISQAVHDTIKPNGRSSTLGSSSSSSRWRSPSSARRRVGVGSVRDLPIRPPIDAAPSIALF